MFCCCLGKKLSTLISCEQALHLGDKVKTGRARGTREETRKRGVGVVGGCPRAALFVRPNRRACSQASTLRTLLPLASGSSHDPPPPPPHPFPSNVVRKDNLLAPFLLACSRLRDGGEKSFSNKKCEKRAGAGERQGATATAPFPKSCASYFRFARFNTFPLYYLRAWHRLPSCSKFNRERMWELLVFLIPLYHVKCPSTCDIYCRESSNSPD